jgi:hypothetical protein
MARWRAYCRRRVTDTTDREPRLLSPLTSAKKLISLEPHKGQAKPPRCIAFARRRQRDRPLTLLLAGTILAHRIESSRLSPIHHRYSVNGAGRWLGISLEPYKPIKIYLELTAKL